MHQSRTSSNLQNPWTLLVLAALTYLLYLVRFGYGYGTSDQDEFLPYLLHLLDPALFEQDWFVQTQLSSFSVRTYFVYALRALCFVFPPETSVFVLYLVSWLGIATGLFNVGHILTQDRLAAAGAMVLLLVATPFWTLGGNDLAHSMLVPSMTAWALGLWGVAFFLERRFLLSALLLGIATWFQALVGLQLAFILGSTLLFGMCIPRKAFFREPPSLLSFGALYLFAASPALIPLFYQQFSAQELVTPEGMPSLFYIMAAFRNPHHYLFDSFDQKRMIQFAALVLTGCLSLIWLRRNRPQVHIRCPLGMAAICVLLWIVAFIGTELIEILTVAKLQLFKTSLLVKSLMGIVLCAGLTQLLPARLYRMIDRLLFSRTWVLALLIVIACTSLYFWKPDRFTQKIYPMSRAEKAVSDAEDWVQAHTPSDAIFAIPPSLSSFRSHARRGIYVNHKAFPYRDADIYTWFDRLNSWAPIVLPDRSDASLLQTLDDAYNGLESDTLQAIISRRPVDYLLRQSPLSNVGEGFEEVYAVDEWYVYKTTRPEPLP